jgi:hypothetical protein
MKVAIVLTHHARRVDQKPAPLVMLSLLAFVAISVTSAPAEAGGDSHYQYSYFSAVQNYGSGSYSGQGYSVILSTLPMLELDSSWNSGNVSFGGEQQWQASVSYSVTVTGPSATVPLDVTYFMSATTTVSGGAWAMAQPGFIYDENYTPVSLNVGGYSDGSSTSGGTIHFSEAAGTTFVAGLDATETLYYQGGSASVLIDPVYSIDPSFALIDPNYLTDYSLTFTAGIQNIESSTAVPLPGAMPLLAVGLVGLWEMAGLRKPRRTLSSNLQSGLAHLLLRTIFRHS